MLMQMTLVLFDYPQNTNFVNNFAGIDSNDFIKQNSVNIAYGPFSFPDWPMYWNTSSFPLNKQTIQTPGIYVSVKSPNPWWGWFGWYKMKYIPDAFSLPETDNTSANRVKIFDYLIYDWSEKEFKGNVGNLKNEDGNSTYPEEDIRHLYFPKDYFNKDTTNGVPLSTPLPIDDSLTKTNNLELNFPIPNPNNAYKNTAIFNPSVLSSFRTDGFKNVVAILPDQNSFLLKPYKFNTWKEGGNVSSTKSDFPIFLTNDGNRNGVDAEVKYVFNDSQLGCNSSNSLFYKGSPDGVFIKESISQIGTVTIDNPIVDAGPYDAFTLNLKVPQFYLRLNYLLKYIKQNVLPRVKLSTQHDDNPQIFDIQIDENNITNIMFAIPDSQISFDPKVCIVRNDTFLNTKKVASELNTWAANDDPSWPANLAEKGFSARTMNIYLNFDFIIESLSEDQYGDVNIYDFLNNLCIGINKALGGVNNLEPVIDETTNIVRLLDTTPIPGTVRNKSSKHNDYKIHLYGYGKKNNSSISNFIRNLSLKTAITPEFATMVTVGATAGGYTKGVEATAFSKWNNGLVDKYKTEFTPGNKETAKSSKFKFNR
jgi:hypothetical protein